MLALKQLFKIYVDKIPYTFSGIFQKYVLVRIYSRVIFVIFIEIKTNR